LNAATANIAPLSISQARSKKSTRDDQESYEQKIEKKSFKENTSKDDFGLTYRDTQKALSYSVTTAPNTSSLGRGIQIPGILTVAPTITPVSATASIAPSQRTFSSKPLNDDLFHSLERKILASAEGATHQSGSPPLSSTPLSIENIDKLNIVHKDDFRLLGSTHGQVSELEDNADNEISEIETHASDGDKYGPSPSDDEVYEDMFAQFEDVKIKKRTHADVEDDEEEVEAKGCGIGSSSGSYNDVMQKGQKTLSLPLTEEEHNQRSKKLKIASPIAAQHRRTDVFDAAGNRQSGVLGGRIWYDC